MSNGMIAGGAWEQMTLFAPLPITGTPAISLFDHTTHSSEKPMPAWAADMTVLDAPPETIIRGEVIDDSHMHGVLALIQNLGLRVVSVNQVADSER